MIIISKDENCLAEFTSGEINVVELPTGQAKILYSGPATTIEVMGFYESKAAANTKLREFISAYGSKTKFKF